MSTNHAGFSEGEQIVLGILRDNIHPGKSEARAYKQDLPGLAVRNASPESLGAFIEVHNSLAGLVAPDHYRTRHADRTSTRGYGISYHTLPIGNGSKAPGIEIQAVLLPTILEYSGFLEAYLRGHRHSPVAGAVDTGEVRAGLPVFRVILRPSNRSVNGLIAAFSDSILYPLIRGI